MKIVTRDVPTPKEGEMLIKVSACAINRPDVMQVPRLLRELVFSVLVCILLPREPATFPAWSVLERLSRSLTVFLDSRLETRFAVSSPEEVMPSTPR